MNLQSALFEPFETALDAFAKNAPTGSQPLAIRAGTRVRELFRQWSARSPRHPTDPTPAEKVKMLSRTPIQFMHYAGFPIEPVSEPVHVSVHGVTADGAPFTWPDAR